MSSRPALARLLFLLLLPVFVGFVLVVLKLGRRADLSFHDWVVRWTARPSDSGRALILYIDDQTDQELPYASLTRTDYARLIRMLKDLGAAAIVLDVEFRKPSPPGSSRIDASSSPHDFALERALRYAGNVILAASYRRQGGGGRDSAGTERGGASQESSDLRLLPGASPGGGLASSSLFPLSGCRLGFGGRHGA